MITLYKPNETDFTHNGIGVLDANIYEAEVEEILNGLYVFTFSYPLFAPHGIEIDGMCIVKVPTPDGDQLFRVATPQPSMGELRVQCYHIFYDLTENLIEDIFITAEGGYAAVNRISKGCQYMHPFTFYSDIQKVASSRLVRKNPVEALLDTGQDNSFINRWGGELKRDNFDVKMLANRGIDRGVVIQHKKDLLGYEGKVDWKSPITRIMPKGFNGLLLPEKYIDSPNMKKYPYPKIRVVEFDHIKAAIGEYADDEDAIPLEEAYRLLRESAQAMYTIQKADQPRATYEILFQELSQTEEYKDYAILQRVYMGDIVTVIHEEDNLKIQAKVISYKYDPLKKEYISLTIGNHKETFTDVSGKIDQMVDQLRDEMPSPSSLIEAAKASATSLINSGFGGNVRVYPERILIMDTANEKTAQKVWQWNVNGLGYSSTGVNGPYGTAITRDGRIVADFITAGKLTGDIIRGGEISGATLRTDNGANYVHINKQYIRLMESNLNRLFIGYYRNKNNRIQPTILMHESVDESNFRDGTLVISQQPLDGYSANIGLAKGVDAYGDVYYPSNIQLNVGGNTNIHGDNYTTIVGKNAVDFRSSNQISTFAKLIRLDATSNMDILAGGKLFLKSTNNTTINSGYGMNIYAYNGAFWAQADAGITLKAGSGTVWMDTQKSIVFNINGQNMLDIVSSNGETDLRFQTAMLRNSNVPGYKTLQVKDGTGNAYNAVTASAFQTSSKREYKTNIRDVQFRALEKIMALHIQQYNLKTDMEDLYEMRMNRAEGEPTVTTKDIRTRYGVIADETDECFVGKYKDSVDLYAMESIHIQAFQEHVLEQKEMNECLIKENEELRSEVQNLNDEVSSLKALVQKLIDDKQ